MKVNRIAEMVVMGGLFVVGFFAYGRSANQPSVAPAGAAKSEGKVISDFNNAGEWGLYKAEGATLDAASAKGQKENALDLKFILGGPEKWVAISKPWTEMKQGQNGVQFSMKSNVESGTPALEVKFVDKDGSVFGYKLPLENQADWKVITIQPSDFTYWWGGNDKLETVEKMDIAISGDSAKGTLSLDDLQLTSQGSSAPASGASNTQPANGSSL